MRKIAGLVFLVIGTIIGSGFSSGKEIFTFFARFGSCAYLGIALACILFYFFIYYFLTSGAKKLKNLDGNKFLSMLIVVISTVFAGSMFAGTTTCLIGDTLKKILITILILLTCFFFTFYGISGLERFNLFLMPVTILAFLGVLFVLLSQKSTALIQTNMLAGATSLVFSIFYVLMNMSTASIVISRSGEGISTRQARISSIIIVIVLASFLIIGTHILQNNLDYATMQMPFLSLCEKYPICEGLMRIIILIGCVTTLLSHCVTIKTSLKNFVKNDKKCTFFAVFVPFCLSFLGFSNIVEILYPLCAIVGAVLLVRIYGNVCK